MGAADSANRGCPAPQTIDLATGESDSSAATVYELESTEPQTVDGREVYRYKLAAAAPEQVTGHVSYYRLGQAEPFRVDEVPGIAKGESRDVTVPEIVADGGTYLRSVMVGNTVRLSYPGRTEASVWCTELKVPSTAGGDDWSSLGGAPYVAAINYRAGSASGETILTDKLYVTRPYTYTPPTRVYVTSGTVAEDGSAGQAVSEYRLDAAASGIAETGHVSFALDTPEAARTADLVYVLAGEAESITWTVQFVSGDKGNAGDQIAEPLALTADDLATAEDGSLVYEPPATIGGYNRAQERVTVNPAGGMVTAYYVSGTGVHDDYSITLRYVNIAAGDGTALETHQETISYTWAEKGSDQAIPVPRTLQGGQYVLIPGQLYSESDTEGCMDLYHSYYAPSRTYTIYYRDVNDELHAETVITRINTIYDDVIVNRVVVPAADATGTGAGGTGTAGAAGAALADTGGVTAINGTGGGDTVLSSGNTAATERIEDVENPLAAGTGQGQGQSDGQGQAGEPGGSGTSGWLSSALLGGGLVAALIAFIALFIKRKKDDESEEA